MRSPGALLSLARSSDGRGGEGRGIWRLMRRCSARWRLRRRLGWVALADTSHWMRAGTYGWQAAEAGFAGVCWTNTMPNLPPWGAKSAALGNNPLVVAIPNE